MKKIFFVLLIIFSIVGLSSCDMKEYYTISFQLDFNGEPVEYKSIVVAGGTVLNIEDEMDLSGYRVSKWFLDERRTKELPSDYVLEEDIIVYASLIKQCKVTYINYDGSSEVAWVDYGNNAKNKILESEEMDFLGWYDRALVEPFDFSQAIKQNVNLYAKWETISFRVTYDLGFEYYLSKEDLFISYFTDFYNFLVERTDLNLEELQIYSCEDFLAVCSDWNAFGRDSFYGVGDKFKDYYSAVDIGGTLENQTDETFVGYCYQNGKYVEFLPHLIKFFAYWRTDEGYTGGSADPNNLGNDFFAEPWASLVDTCKFFKFTSANLNDTYPWFRSERVKNALDDVPSIYEVSLDEIGNILDPVYLPNLNNRNGYYFVGWFTKEGEPIEVVYEEMTVYAQWNKVK